MNAALASRRRPARGFTLVELMMAVVVVGILTAIAIPSYSAYLIRGQRAAAKATLQQAAQLMERNFSANGCYNSTTVLDCQQATNQNQISLATFGLANSPSDGGAFTYAITLVPAPTATTFTLTATPCAAAGGACPAPQSNASFDDPDCGALTITNTGIKGAGGNIGGGNPDQCWNR
jgi:type IV pilus assembly protein PilE